MYFCLHKHAHSPTPTYTHPLVYCAVCRKPLKALLATFAPLFLTVRPDPPVSINWTLLDISSSGLNYDVLVNWEPPPSADTKFGWMNILYELQYRDRNATNWEIVSLL